MFELRIFDPIGAAVLRSERDQIRDEIVGLMARERELDAELNREVSHRKRKRPTPRRLRKVVAR
jgi:hypothetical protein